MTACARCAGPLDPNTIHVQHFGCNSDDWDDCDCPEVCAGCCTDPDCALRQPQETTVTPEPLTDDQWADVKDNWQKHWHSEGLVSRLVATVEQARRERDAAHAVIRHTIHVDDGWPPSRECLWGDDETPMSPAEVDAVRRAQATPEETNQ